MATKTKTTFIVPTATWNGKRTSTHAYTAVVVAVYLNGQEGVATWHSSELLAEKARIQHARSDTRPGSKAAWYAEGVVYQVRTNLVQKP